MNCKDKELNAKLYSNRAIAQFYLGEKFCIFLLDCRSQFDQLKVFCWSCSLLLELIFHTNSLL